MRINSSQYWLNIDGKVVKQEGYQMSWTGLTAAATEGVYSPNPNAVPGRKGVTLSLSDAARVVKALEQAYPGLKGKLMILDSDDVYGFGEEQAIAQIGGEGQNYGHSAWWVTYGRKVAFHPFGVALASLKGTINLDNELRGLEILAELK